jgi:hypothetical protein
MSTLAVKITDAEEVFNSNSVKVSAVRCKICESDCYRWEFGWEIAHAAITRRPPIPLYTIVARTEGYTYAAKFWALSIVQGPIFYHPCRPCRP